MKLNGKWLNKERDNKKSAYYAPLPSLRAQQKVAYKLYSRRDINIGQ